jgi:hypothetical protein
LYAASGRLIPFNWNAPTGSTVTAFSTLEGIELLPCRIASSAHPLVDVFVFIGPAVRANSNFTRLLRLYRSALPRHELSLLFHSETDNAAVCDCITRLVTASGAGHRDATMILVAYRHGLRTSELCELTDLNDLRVPEDRRIKLEDVTDVLSDGCRLEPFTER